MITTASTGKYHIVSFTKAGARLEARLAASIRAHLQEDPTGVCESAKADPKSLGAWAKEHFQSGNVLIFIGACGIAVRTIAPLVQDKATDPAVLVIDEKGAFVIPVLSGHIGGGVEAADFITKLLGATPVHTTASDVNGLFAVDVFARKNHCTINDLKRAGTFTAQLLQTGHGVCLLDGAYWDTVAQAVPDASDLPEEIKVRILPETKPGEAGRDGEVPQFLLSPALRRNDILQLIPRCIVVGMGCRKGKSAEELETFLMEHLKGAGIDPAALRAIVSSDVKREEAGLRFLAAKLDVAFVTYSAEELMAQAGDFAGSSFVEEVTGADNVCERAVAAYGCERILVKKTAGDGMTFAAGIKASNGKKLYIVGIGPGRKTDMTLRAVEALEESTVIAGYTVYCDLVEPDFPGKTYIRTAMTREEERVRLAFEAASGGETVSLVCSGDAGVYGLAGLACAMAEQYPGVELGVIPGVTAALSGAALLGAPLIHDFCVISLSDRLTPWEKIEKRLLLAAEADLVIVLYNPESRSRSGYLQKACNILLTRIGGERICGIVRNIAREGESREVMTLSELSQVHADMFSTVFIGNASTKNITDYMVTARGYHSEG